MKRAFKYLAIFLGALIALTAIALAVVVNLDFNNYKYLIEGQVREATGRDLEIRGPLEVDLSLTPSVAVQDVRFSNASWGSEADMLHLQEARLKMDLVPLIFDGVYDIQLLQVKGVRLLVEKNRDGIANLEFRAPGEPTATPDTAPKEPEATEFEPGRIEGIEIPVLRDVLLQDIQVRYNDLAAGETRRMMVDSLRVQGEGPFAPLAVSLKGAADGVPLTLDGELGAPSEMLNPERLWTVDLQGDLAGTKLALSGGIDEPAKGRGINILFSTETAEIGTLSRITEPLAGQTVPELGPFKLSLVVSGSADDRLQAQDIQLALGRADFLSVNVSGQIDDLVSQSGIDIKGDVRVADITRLSRLAGQTIPSLGRFQTGFSLQGSVAEQLQLRDFSFSLKRDGVIDVSGGGEIADVVRQAGIAIRVRALVPDMAILPRTEGVTLPDAGRVETALLLTGDAKGALDIRELDATVSRGKDYVLRVSGQVADVLRDQALDLALDFNSPNLARLSALAGTPLPPVGPVSVAGTIAGEHTDVITVDGLDVNVGKSDLAGIIKLSGLTNTPNVVARLSSDALHLQDFAAVRQDGGTRKASGNGGGGAPTGQGGDAGADKGKWVIPDTPIDLQAMNAVNAEVSLNLAKLVLPKKGSFQDVALKAALKKGVLTVSDLRLKDDTGGTLTGNMVLNGAGKAAAFEAALNAKQLEASNFLRLAGYPAILEGPLKLDVDLKSRGRSPHELAAGMNGSMQAAVLEGFVNSSEVRAAFGRTTQEIADLLLGNSKKERIPLYCFVAGYNVTNGLMQTKALVLDTNVSTVTSSGTIDLGKEELALTVTPQRDVFGIGAAIPVRVGGTFRSPNALPDPALTLAGVGGALLGAPLLPLAIIGGTPLVNDADSPCVNLRPGNLEERQQSEDGLKQLQEDPEKALEDAGKKILDDALQGIFGN